ncbi:unnamed protein product [Gongylonema pulchrum]|uniref:Ku_N domain-containing protein n=1 Tax=Gongylonema pulchrum TaxID=637853 RepID=A0A183DT58_9BILA|nr:unnamed protein product [Gongylonema pulchrum]
MEEDEDEFGLDDPFGEMLSLADGGSTCTIFLIDAAAKMFERDGGGDAENDCPFRRALKIMRRQMINKGVTSTAGQYTSCILLNTVRLFSEALFESIL